MTYEEVLRSGKLKRIAEREEHEMFINIAKLLCKKSHCVSHQVACLFVKEGRIVSTGINGTVAGVPNCDEVFDKDDFDREKHHYFSDKYEIHAEMNGIIYASKHGIALKDANVYVTIIPCSKCLKALSAMGIKNVYYGLDYDKRDYDIFDKHEMMMYNNINLKQIIEKD